MIILKHIIYFFKRKVLPEPFIRLVWESKINYRIIDNVPDKDKFWADVQTPGIARSIDLYRIVIKILRLIFYKKKDLSRI